MLRIKQFMLVELLGNYFVHDVSCLELVERKRLLRFGWLSVVQALGIFHEALPRNKRNKKHGTGYIVPVWSK